MPILTHDRDVPEEVRRRSAQEDPWVMYLVVCQDVPASASDVLLAAAQGTMRCAEAFRADPVWTERFAAWAERSFRKVTLRAKGTAWARLAAYDGATGDVRGGVPLVRVLPPRLRSECDALLRGLQVYNPAPESLPADVESAGEPPACAMRFVRNPGVAMSVGKQAAQIAHAVLMCAWSRWATDARYAAAFGEWRARGYPRWLAPRDAWSRVRATGDGVVVCDAGLTEVDPGSETVIALPPGHAWP
jgi:peptidyl-tRNA hydrolase